MPKKRATPPQRSSVVRQPLLSSLCVRKVCSHKARIKQKTHKAKKTIKKYPVTKKSTKDPFKWEVGDIVCAPRFRSMPDASFTSTKYGVKTVDDFINIMMQDNGVPRTKVLSFIESQYNGFADRFFEKRAFKRINLHPAVIVGPVPNKPGFYQISWQRESVMTNGSWTRVYDKTQNIQSASDMIMSTRDTWGMFPMDKTYPELCEHKKKFKDRMRMFAKYNSQFKGCGTYGIPSNRS